jgi:hypothetical protein
MLGLVTVKLTRPTVLAVVTDNEIVVGLVTVAEAAVVVVPVAPVVSVAVTVAPASKPCPLMTMGADVVVRGTADGLTLVIPAAVTVKSPTDVTGPPSLLVIVNE